MNASLVYVLHVAMKLRMVLAMLLLAVVVVALAALFAEYKVEYRDSDSELSVGPARHSR